MLLRLTCRAQNVGLAAERAPLRVERIRKGGFEPATLASQSRRAARLNDKERGAALSAGYAGAFVVRPAIRAELHTHFCMAARL